MPTVFSTSPYYDDYDKNKKFYRILFRPGTAVQARELTQLQTIFGNQIEQFADHIFKNGAQVKPGQIAYDLELSFVKIEPTINGFPINLNDIDPDNQNNVGDIFIEGERSGVKAKVIKIVGLEGSDPFTIFVKYVNKGTNGTSSTFDKGNVDAIPTPIQAENLRKVGSANPFAKIMDSNMDPLGNGCSVSIEAGVYYVNGIFANVERQTIILDKYTNTPTYKIGLEVIESIITSSEDDSLNDNAQGSSNFAAPGAHRYSVSLNLVKRNVSSLTEDNQNFVELLRLKNGIREKQVEETAYSLLEETLARRTYDESGDYYIRPFGIDIREHLKTDTNRGVYPISSPDPGAKLGEESKLAVGIEPSKAYVKGYEIQTLATTWLDVDKARDTLVSNNSSIRANFGNWVYVWNPYNFPSINNYQKINLYDISVLYDSNGQISNASTFGSLTPIGTARVRGFEYVSGTPGNPFSNPTAIYKMYLFDIQMVSGKQFSEVNSFYSPTDFSDDPVAGIICQDLYLINANISPSPNDVVISSTGRVTIVSYNSSSGSAIVRPTINTGSTFYPKVLKNEFVTYGVSGTAKVGELLSIQETGSNTLIYRLPKTAIKTVKGENNQVDTTYTIKRVIVTTITNNTILVNVSGDEVFDTFNLTDYILSVAENSSNFRGHIINLNGLPVNVSGSTLTIGGLNAYNGLQVKLIAPVVKLVATSKAKDLQTKTQTFATYNIDSVNYLDEVDIYSLISIKDFYGNDVTERFSFDNGQRDSFYQRGSFLLRKGSTPPDSPITVEYSFFRHGSGGDYFSVDSYNQNQINYSNIPTYISRDTGQVYQLSNCLDFRPRTNIASEGPMSDYPIGQSEILKPNANVRCDFQYYVGRFDKIFLTKRGEFKVVRGIASERPQEPQDIADAMLLYTLFIPAYTYSPSSVSVKRIDNRRYTMRDIGKLEKRILNLEYYTTLSLLEKETADMYIPDDSTGLNRFKNGFIVDSFVGHGIGDVLNPDYSCSIDIERGEARPEFIQNYLDLNLQTTDPDSGNAPVSTNYAKTGDLITLPYVNVTLVEQPFASNFININPYNVFNWVGSIELDPETDLWRDTNRLPDIIQNNNAAFEAELVRLSPTLGTVWNEWQTQWTGVVSESSTFTTTEEVTRGITIDESRMNAARMDNRLPPTALITTTTTSTIENKTQVVQSNQVRTGVVTTVVPRETRQQIEDRLVNNDIIPFMRTRDVYFKAKRFKPSTLLYPFFDNVNVSRFCSGSGGSGFTTVPPVVTFSAPPSGTTAQGTTILRDGKVVFIEITNPGSGYTSAPTVSFSSIPNGATAPSSADVIVSVENGRVVSAVLKMKTDENGNLEGMFRIPNTDTIRFRTGTRIFRLVDDRENRRVFTTTFGECRYVAQGFLETRQSTILSTREPQLVRTNVSENRILTNVVTTSNEISRESTIESGWLDPVAQTFITTDKGGSFITSVDIFFASKDDTIPVTLQIRDVVNGYPGQRIIPFGEVVLNPVDVVIDPDGTRNLPTKFTFKSPIYIQENVEYAIVLISNSNNYNVWISRMGENQIGTTNPISEQPYAGSFFKSQNASTWTAEQLEDLKFTIYKAKFDTSVIGNVIFVNDVVPSQSLDSLCFWTVEGSEKVRVYQKNHGMPFNTSPASSKVLIQGVTGTLNGIPSSEFNGIHEISDVTLDTYTINLVTPATATGFTGNEGITATRNYQMDVVHPIVQNIVFPNTELSFSIKTVSGKSVSGNQQPYSKTQNWEPIIVNSNVEFTNPKLIASALNEIDLVQAGVGVYNNKSFVLRSLFISEYDNLSPVIDTQRIGVVVVGNRIADYTHKTVNINSPSGYDLRPASRSINIANCSLLSDDNSINTSSDVFTDQTILGKYIHLTSPNNNFNSFETAIKVIEIASPRKLIVDAPITTTLNTSAVIDVYDFFTAEEGAFDTSNPAKYITRPLNLLEPANSLRVFVTAFRSFDSDFDIYYRVGRSTDNKLFEEQPYKKMNLDNIPQNNLERFVEYKYSVEEEVEFTTVSFKIVMRSTNSANVPRFRDIRGIALSS
jgi:hypothetical protein